MAYHYIENYRISIIITIMIMIMIMIVIILLYVQQIILQLLWWILGGSANHIKITLLDWSLNYSNLQLVLLRRSLLWLLVIIITNTGIITDQCRVQWLFYKTAAKSVKYEKEGSQLLGKQNCIYFPYPYKYWMCTRVLLPLCNDGGFYCISYWLTCDLNWFLETTRRRAATYCKEMHNTFNKMPTTSGVPRRSPIQVLTRPNAA